MSEPSEIDGPGKQYFDDATLDSLFEAVVELTAQVWTYRDRAIVLETVAAVPGMVGGALQHLRSLRRLEDDGGLIRKLLDEAENERMHLMTFVQIARPTQFERLLILLGQGHEGGIELLDGFLVRMLRVITPTCLLFLSIRT